VFFPFVTPLDIFEANFRKGEIVGKDTKEEEGEALLFRRTIFCLSLAFFDPGLSEELVTEGVASVASGDESTRFVPSIWASTRTILSRRFFHLADKSE
jgi:hypothetical protein